MDRHQRIIEKFKSIQGFCKATGRNYAKTYYALKHAVKPSTLEGIDKDIKTAKPIEEKEEITKEMIDAFRIRVRNDYGTQKRFAEETGIRNSLASEIITGKHRFYTKAVREAFEVLNLIK